MSTRIKVSEPMVTIGGQQLDRHDIAKLDIQKDIDYPDSVSINLSNFGGEQSGGFIQKGSPASQRFSAKFKPDADIKVQVKVEGEGTHDVFEGQLSGFQPKFDTHLPVTTHVRGMNALAKLGRQRKTRTYKERTLKQIVEEIAGDNGLSAEFGRKPPTLRYEHLYQNNQTDLEYLRWLASRTCSEVYCEGKKLLFRQRQKDEGPTSKLSWTEEGVGKALESFTPEFATTGQTKKVTCKYWDPNKKKELVSVANASGSPLGGELGSNSESAGENIDFHDKPFYTQEEGDLLAKSLLEERQMNFITAEATCLGDGKLKPGMVIEVDTQDDRFDGKYYIAGVHFHFSHSSSGLGGGAGMGGFRCKLKLKRDAGKSG